GHAPRRGAGQDVHDEAPFQRAPGERLTGRVEGLERVPELREHSGLVAAQGARSGDHDRDLLWRGFLLPGVPIDFRHKSLQASWEYTHTRMNPHSTTVAGGAGQAGGDAT